MGVGRHLGRVLGGMVLPLVALAAVLHRRRRVAAGERFRGGGDSGGGGDGGLAGVREPRRPKPGPPSARMAIEEDGEAVQI
jgi:hypothetical protein